MVRAYADGALIYAPLLDDHKLQALKVMNNVEKAGTAEIAMPPGHPAYNTLTSFRTIITITRRGRLIFRGRPLPAEDDIYGVRTIICEGERCFLRDSTMRAYAYENANVAAIFRDAINAHNEQAGDAKRFRIGLITVTAVAEEFKKEQAEQVSDTVDALVKTYGGYITFTTDDEGYRVINWLAELTGRSGQVIDFGVNLLDYSRSGANTDLATAILPYGAKDSNTGKYLDIKSVNGGRDYIQDDVAVDLRGFILKPFYWDDIKTASALLTRARQQLAASKLIVTSLQLTAVDLSAMDKDIDSFDAGDWVRVRSAPHSLDEDFQVRERSYDLLDPAQDRVAMGAEVATLTGSDVAGDKNSLARLQQTQKSIASDYEKAILDAGGQVGDDSIGNVIRMEMQQTYAAKVNTRTQYMTSDGLLLQWGSVNITATSANTPASNTVRFAYPYAEAPTVLVNPVATDRQACVPVSTSRASATGVGITAALTAPGTVTVYWLAIGKSA